MPRLTDRQLAVMRQRAQDVQDQAAERERQRVAVEMWASPTGQFLRGFANVLVSAFQPGAWRPLFDASPGPSDASH